MSRKKKTEKKHSVMILKLDAGVQKVLRSNHRTSKYSHPTRIRQPKRNCSSQYATQSEKGDISLCSAEKDTLKDVIAATGRRKNTTQRNKLLSCEEIKTNQSSCYTKRKTNRNYLDLNQIKTCKQKGKRRSGEENNKLQIPSKCKIINKDFSKEKNLSKESCKLDTTSKSEDFIPDINRIMNKKESISMKKHELNKFSKVKIFNQVNEISKTEQCSVCKQKQKLKKSSKSKVSNICHHVRSLESGQQSSNIEITKLFSNKKFSMSSPFQTCGNSLEPRRDFEAVHTSETITDSGSIDPSDLKAKNSNMKGLCKVISNELDAKQNHRITRTGLKVLSSEETSVTLPDQNQNALPLETNRLLFAEDISEFSPTQISGSENVLDSNITKTTVNKSQSQKCEETASELSRDGNTVNFSSVSEDSSLHQARKAQSCKNVSLVKSVTVSTLISPSNILTHSKHQSPTSPLAPKLQSPPPSLIQCPLPESPSRLLSPKIEPTIIRHSSSSLQSPKLQAPSKPHCSFSVLPLFNHCSALEDCITDTSQTTQVESEKISLTSEELFPLKDVETKHNNSSTKLQTVLSKLRKSETCTNLSSADKEIQTSNFTTDASPEMSQTQLFSNINTLSEENSVQQSYSTDKVFGQVSALIHDEFVRNRQVNAFIQNILPQITGVTCLSSHSHLTINGSFVAVNKAWHLLYKMKKLIASGGLNSSDVDYQSDHEYNQSTKSLKVIWTEPNGKCYELPSESYCEGMFLSKRRADTLSTVSQSHHLCDLSVKSDCNQGDNSYKPIKDNSDRHNKNKEDNSEKQKIKDDNFNQNKLKKEDLALKREDDSDECNLNKEGNSNELKVNKEDNSAKLQELERSILKGSNCSRETFCITNESEMFFVTDAADDHVEYVVDVNNEKMEVLEDVVQSGTLFSEDVTQNEHDAEMDVSNDCSMGNSQLTNKTGNSIDSSKEKLVMITGPFGDEQYIVLTDPTADRISADTCPPSDSWREDSHAEVTHHKPHLVTEKTDKVGKNLKSCEVHNVGDSSESCFEMKICDAGSEVFVRCDKCSAVFRDVAGLKQHIREKHVSKNHSCGVCGKTFVEKRYLHAHLNRHFGLKKHTCSVCGWKFFERHKLKLHLETHKSVDKRQLPYKCVVCQHQFHNRATWSDHMNTHTGAKPFACAVCPARFAHRIGLKRHWLVHDKQTPFKCEYCEKGFKLKTKLQDHVTVHTGRGKHSCEICKKVFTASASLKRHMFSAHLKTSSTADSKEETVFRCQKCGCVFPTRTDTQQHAATCCLSQIKLETSSFPNLTPLERSLITDHTEQENDDTQIESLLTSLENTEGDNPNLAEDHLCLVNSTLDEVERMKLAASTLADLCCYAQEMKKEEDNNENLKQSLF